MKLITLAVADGSAAAIAYDDCYARIIGSVTTSRFADVGEILRGGHLNDLATLEAQAGEQVTYAPQDLLPPVLLPGAVLCVGLNYRSHILEMGRSRA